MNPQILDLNLLLSDMQTMLKRLIGEDIDIAIFPGPELGQVKADRGQLEQVVLNLCATLATPCPKADCSASRPPTDLRRGLSSRARIRSPREAT